MKFFLHKKNGIFFTAVKDVIKDIFNKRVEE